MGKFVLLLSVLLALLFLPVQAEADFAFEHTILIYMIGSDLQSSGLATDDMEEMLAAGISEDTCILLLAGGTSAPFELLPSEGNTVYRLADGAFLPVSTLANDSISKPETLRDFVAFAHSYAPARSTGLIFWNHGYGPLEGFGSNAQEDGDRLTLFEIAEGLSNSKRLDFICFDACLMSSVETAAFLAPYADYLIASQETEPAQGWDYAFLSAIEPGMNGGKIGELIIDSCFEYYETLYAEYFDHMPMLSLACIDLQAIEGLEAAMDALFSDMSVGLVNGDYSDIVRARIDSRSVGKFTTSTDYDLVDLQQCAAQLEDLYPESAAQVLEALSSTVVYSHSNVENLYGLSVYFPYENIPLLLGRWGSVGESIGCSAGYRQFLHDYALLWMQKRLVEWTSQPVEGKLGDYTLTLTDEQVENFASARYVVLKEEDGEYWYTFVGRDAFVEGNTLRIPYEGIELYVQTEEGDCPLLASRRDEDDAYIYYHANAMFNEPDSYDFTTCTLRLRYDKESGEYTCIDCIPEDEEDLSTGKQQTLDMYSGTTMEVWTISAEIAYDENGNILPTSQWNMGGVHVWGFPTTDTLIFGQRSLPEGLEDYVIVVDVMDTFGNTFTSMVTPIGSSSSAGAAQEIPTFACDSEEENALLFAHDGLEGRLTGIGISADTYGDACVFVDVSLQNSADTERALEMFLPTVNGASIDANWYSSDVTVPANASIQHTFELMVEELVNARTVSPLETIDILWRVNSETETSFISTHVTCDIHWKASLQVAPVSSYQILEGGFYANEYLELSLIALTQIEGTLHLQLCARNLTDSLICLSSEYLSINDWFAADSSRSVGDVIAPYASRTVRYDLPLDGLLSAGETPNHLRMAFYATDPILSTYSETDKALFTTGEISWLLVPKETLLLANQSGVRISLLPAQPLTDTYLSYVYFPLLIENSTRSTISIQFVNERINGRPIDSYSYLTYADVPEDMKLLEYKSAFADYFSEFLGGEPLTSLQADIEIWNRDTSVRLAVVPDVEFIYPAD